MSGAPRPEFGLLATFSYHGRRDANEALGGNSIYFKNGPKFGGPKIGGPKIGFNRIKRILFRPFFGALNFGPLLGPFLKSIELPPWYGGISWQFVFRPTMVGLKRDRGISG